MGTILYKWPDIHQLYAWLDELENSSGGCVKNRKIGASVEGRELRVVTLTDAAVADEYKQVILITAAEHGHERNTVLVIQQLINWLLNDAEGKETLRRQIVAIIPVVNVDGYAAGHIYEQSLPNANGVNLFADYHYDGSAPSQPESLAVWKVMEELAPDAFASLHGMSVNHDAAGLPRVWENTNIAFTAQYERCYSGRVVERINAAAAACGYPQDLGEEDLERILPRLPGFEYHSLPTFEHVATACSYCYNRFHTLAMVMEIGPIESGFIRTRELIRIGNERWEYEFADGYPNNIITAAAISRFVLKATGSNAQEKRKSRILLWQHSHNIMTGTNRLHATHFLGFLSRCKKDIKPLCNLSDCDSLLNYFENQNIRCPKTAEWIESADLLKQPIMAWSDSLAVGRVKERLYGKDFVAKDYDDELCTDSLLIPAAVRVRIDLRTKPELVLINDVVMNATDVKYWTDARYGYVEVALPPDWQLTLFALQTSPVPGYDR